MKFLIYVAAFGVVVYLGRNYLKGWLISLRKEKIKTVSPDLVYMPITSSRTFYFALEIEEIGQGKATITVVKNPLIK